MNTLAVVGYILLVIYLISLVFITLFCLMQLFLLLRYLSGRHGNRFEDSKPEMAIPAFPMVTIQLPIFNEKFVVERLIDQVIQMDYPKDRLEIHVLDDSTDETILLSKAKVAHYQTLGYNIACITRKDRVGYKAGALKNGMDYASGAFIAIFDADFLPEPDFLNKTIRAFDDHEIGVVQTRWAHLNQSYSLLTELQALQLNVHFTVEQKGRYKAGYMLQFNGTAGIWRTECIHDAGGWEADTLTEDLDLSYRAQMKGWKIKYMEEVTTPSELPVDINGLKSQQFRWMKGGAETAVKMLAKVWRSNIQWYQKVHATHHLLSSSIFIFVFLISILSFPVLFMVDYLNLGIQYFSVFLVSLLAIIVVYFVANVQVAWPKTNKLRMMVKFLCLFPIFLSVSMALSLHNAWAVVQGFIGKKTSFVRTPKYGITNQKKQHLSKAYFSKKLDWIVFFETLLLLYFLIAAYTAITTHKQDFLILHLMLVIGYSILLIYAVRAKIS